MAKITIDNFVGTRTRFQRLRDAKLFSGWIEKYADNVIVLSTNTNYAVVVGDEFRIEGFGHRVSMTVNAKLEEILRLDVENEGLVKKVEGTDAKIVEARRIHLRMRVSSPVRLAASKESLRVKTPMLPVLIDQVKGKLKHVVLAEQAGQQVQGYCVDAGLQGLGFISAQPMKPDTEIKLHIQSKHGMIVCTGNLRYCAPDRERDGMYRCGVHLDTFPRIMAPRWEAFLDDIG